MAKWAVLDKLHDKQTRDGIVAARKRLDLDGRDFVSDDQDVLGVVCLCVCLCVPGCNLIGVPRYQSLPESRATKFYAGIYFLLQVLTVCPLQKRKP